MSQTAAEIVMGLEYFAS